jgi:1-acyl-sn-glycerol-3-phosphate acyltransferase
MVPFLRTLFFFVVFWVHQILILPLLLFSILYYRRTDKPSYFGIVDPITHAWGKMVCFLGGVRLQVEDNSGLPEKEGVLFVSNHQGDFDIPILLAGTRRPLAFVAKKELENIPLVTPWMKQMGCIFLDRENRRKQVAQIKKTVEQLQEGLSMVIFPEGTRSRGPEMGEFAKGSLQVAVRAGVRIVPVTLKDTYTLFPKGSKLLPGGRARVILHPAIQPADLSEDERNHLQETVKGIIQAGLDR